MVNFHTFTTNTKFSTQPHTYTHFTDTCTHECTASLKPKAFKNLVHFSYQVISNKTNNQKLLCDHDSPVRMYVYYASVIHIYFMFVNGSNWVNIAYKMDGIQHATICMEEDGEQNVTTTKVLDLFIIVVYKIYSTKIKYIPNNQPSQPDQPCNQSMYTK